MECDSHCFAAYSLFFSENVKFKIRFEEPMPWHVDRAYHHSQTPLFLVPCANQIFSDIIFYFCSAVALAGLLLIAPIYFFLQKPWPVKDWKFLLRLKVQSFFSVKNGGQCPLDMVARNYYWAPFQHRCLLSISSSSCFLLSLTPVFKTNFV